MPQAQRAVGSALAASYRWGPERKLAILGWEAARSR